MSGYVAYSPHSYYELQSSHNIIPSKHSGTIEAYTNEEVDAMFDSNIAKLNEYEKLSNEMSENYRKLTSSITAITTHPGYNKSLPLKKRETLADTMKHDSKLVSESNKQMLMLGSITLATLVIFALL